MEVQSLITQSLLESAGQGRLPPIINIKTEVLDETQIMFTMEFAVYEHIKKIVNFSKLYRGTFSHPCSLHFDCSLLTIFSNL